MRCLRAVFVLALLAVFADRVGAHIGLVAATSLYITVRAAEPAPLDLLNDPQDEELFVRADVQYPNTDLLYLNVNNFRLIDANGVAYYPQTYDGVSPLLSHDLIARAGRPAAVSGWLLFVVPRGASNLSLLYKLPKTRGSANVTVGGTSPFTPQPSARRSYAVAAQAALQAYLLDEAMTAGYIRVDVDELYGAGHQGAVPGDVRARLGQGRAALAQDHRAFDLVPASGPDAQGLKRQADVAFNAVENDLADALALRSAGEWMAWRATFDAHDRALADLYQTWPGLQLNVILPPRTSR